MAFAQANLDYGSVEHVNDLHIQHKASITFAQIVQNKWIQTPPLVLADAIIQAEAFDGINDAYMSVNPVGRHKARTIENTCYLTSNFIDADFYKKDLTFEEAFSILLKTCEKCNIPYPTKVFNSGRGLYALWIFKKPIYCGVKSEKQIEIKSAWAYTQDNLIKCFKRIGADPACKDASRVLRLAHSVNSKSLTPVMAYTIEKGDRIEPNKLTKPLSNFIYSKQKATSVKKKTSAINYSVSNKVTKILTPYSLCLSRMQDLRKLAELRGGCFTDHRAMAIFYYGCFVAWYAGTTENLLWKVSEFMSSCIQASSKYCYSSPERHLKAIINRFDMTTSTDYKSPDNFLYKITNEHILNCLEITEEEQTHMLTLIGKPEKQKRNTAYQSKKRRAAGIVERASYEASRTALVEAKKQKAKELREQGISLRGIAKQLNISVGSVHSYLQY